ncbi:MAG TPA: GDSL-type esterase/lipase family protein [Chitinophaga sp.]|uniref:SGNH/GDSL hydrolase family protein n=1 Tax=Chitinophaga sp. TaxID=1869181 RepID=UPI002CCC58A7|nr:GDSL-type esterase/lipase family protein [Chitinophaga sp.]HVI44803.1 GDSL-type esterase/lipase family protein [Chitinophaga sp.]
MKRTFLLACICSCLVSCISRQYMVLNKGIGGNNTNDLLKRLDRDVVAERPDLVVIMVGTNDMVNSGKWTTYTRFTDNYRQIIRKLKTEKISMVLMSPPPVDTGYIFKRHERVLYHEQPNARLDSIDCIIRMLAAENHVHFIDINNVFKQYSSPSRDAHSLVINSLNYGREDGVHPTKDGYRIIASQVFEYLQHHHLLKKNRKIVCFGDSITYGAFMAGAGTAEGDTYPAFLYDSIKDHRKRL